MIPSPSKLVLLYLLVLLVLPAHSAPTLYDMRQTSDKNENVQIEVDGFETVLIPSSSMLTLGMLMLGRGMENKVYSKRERSPYTVDLENSQVPLTKLDTVTPKIEMVMLEHIAEPSVVSALEEEKLVPSQPEMETKTPLKPGEANKDNLAVETLVVAVKEKKEPEEPAKKKPLNVEEPKKEVVKVKKPVKEIQKKKEMKETLTLIGEKLEECGPDGHRDETGQCIFEKMV